MVPAEERVSSFEAVSEVFDPDTAACEAGRCLQCELRFQIDPPRLGTTIHNRVFPQGRRASDA